MVAFFWRFSFCFITLVVASPAIAEQCNTIADDDARLNCWDKAFPPPEDVPASSSVATPDAPVPATSGKWNVQYDKSKIDDLTNVYAFLSSNETVPGRYDNGDVATLNIRCLENKTAAFLVFGGAFMSSSEYNNYGDVTYRVDGKPAVTKKFDASTDNEALGLWYGGTSIPFIKQLLGGSRLVVRATPYNESPVELTFDIEGVSEAVKPVRNVCKW